MPLPYPEDLFSGDRAAAAREIMPTALDTAGLRELGAGVLARSVFSARATNAVFVSKIGEVAAAMEAGTLSDGQARTALWETLKATGYTPEGGFPDAPPGAVPPALKGTLQDLSSFRRLDLIVRTQRALMRGAGEQLRRMNPERLRAFPGIELVRFRPAGVPRDWPARWALAGGKPPGPGYAKNAYMMVGERTGMIALVGDPVWGELGSFDNFPDALGVDHSPFCFNSEMWQMDVSRERCDREGIKGPDGQSIDDFLSGLERPRVMAGEVPLPAPQMSLQGADPKVVERFLETTKATPAEGRPGMFGFSDILAREIAAHDANYYPKGGGR